MTLKDTILREAISLATRQGLYAMTRRNVAAAAGAGTGTINYHFESMDKLREAVLTHAIKHEVMPLLALYVGVPRIARRITPELRQRVAQYIAAK